jgi:hypothetical protein
MGYCIIMLLPKVIASVAEGLVGCDEAWEVMVGLLEVCDAVDVGFTGDGVSKNLGSTVILRSLIELGLLEVACCCRGRL